MSKPQRDQLLATLREAETPKARRKACQQLIASGDPSIIPALRDAYEDDPDEKVRMIARRGLMRFRALEQRLSRKGRLANRLLGLLLILLIAGFGASLVLHATGAVEDLRQGKATPTFRALQATERTALVAQVSGYFNELQSFAAALRNETVKFNANSRPDCETIPGYEPPGTFSLSDDDQFVYPDLALITAKMAVIQQKLPVPLQHLQQACRQPEKPLESILAAAVELDGIDALVQEGNQLLQRAIASPAPTQWPTPTPQPPSATPTVTPSPTATPAPPTASPESGAVAPAGTTTALPATTPLPLESPTATLSPTPALPLPPLDYPTIIAELRLRFADSFLLDLQNPYGTGMLDQWQQAVSALGQTTTNYCTLSTWPAPYALPPEQAALIDNVTVADALLEDLLRLQTEGFTAAQRARALYERDCGTLALSSSASDGIALTTEAVDKLQRARALLDAVANRR